VRAWRVISVCRNFLCQAVESSGFLRAGKGPKLTKQKKKKERVTCRVRHPGEGLHTAQGWALVSVARGSLSLHQAFRILFEKWSFHRSASWQVRYPLETHHDSVVDEPQLGIRFYLGNLSCTTLLPPPLPPGPLPRCLLGRWYIP